MFYKKFHIYSFKILSIFLLIHISYFSFSQSKIVQDSLKLLYNTASSDTSKILFLAEMGDTASAKKGLIWAEKIKFQKGIIRNKLVLLNSDLTEEIHALFNFEDLIPIIRNLEMQSEKINDVESIIRSYLCLGNHYYLDNHDINRSILNYKKALE